MIWCDYEMMWLTPWYGQKQNVMSDRLELNKRLKKRYLKSNLKLSSRAEPFFSSESVETLESCIDADFIVKSLI